MILFIGFIPTEQNRKVGSVQRVIAIDQSFSEERRVLIQFSGTGNVALLPKREMRGKLTVYWMNYLLHLPFFIYLLLRAKFVYVHTPGVALRVLPIYFFFKVITDFHGVAPEELRMSGRPSVAVIYTYVDRFLLSWSWACVFVTESMARHMREKYPHHPAKRAFIIPIFAREFQERFDPKTERRYLIYSGGLQPWQCIDQMISAIAQMRSDLPVMLLCGQEEELKSKVKAAGLQARVTVRSASINEVREFYLRSKFGFVLREDSVVNRVACPTKLVEYLHCGVIPIVLNPNIGDFYENGYAYLRLTDLLQGRIPRDEELVAMCAKNLHIVKTLAKKSDLELGRLVSECVGCRPRDLEQGAEANG
jgi:glycosyltransferase involved in cell wall biosynthesis